MPEKWRSTLNALVVANTGLSACWLFRQELLVCHVNRKKESLRNAIWHRRLLMLPTWWPVQMVNVRLPRKRRSNRYCVISLRCP
ncbi:hypothetical protein C9186_23995, partial [Escherichia coli]